MGFIKNKRPNKPKKKTTVKQKNSFLLHCFILSFLFASLFHQSIPQFILCFGVLVGFFCTQMKKTFAEWLSTYARWFANEIKSPPHATNVDDDVYTRKLGAAHPMEMPGYVTSSPEWKQALVDLAEIGILIFGSPGKLKDEEALSSSSMLTNDPCPDILISDLELVYHASCVMILPKSSAQGFEKKINTANSEMKHPALAVRIKTWPDSQILSQISEALASHSELDNLVIMSIVWNEPGRHGEAMMKRIFV